MKKKNKEKNKYINDFPIIIMVAVAILIIILVNVYLSFKPYDTFYKSGYVVLSNNMTYNLINNNTINDEYTVGVAAVNSGDAIYKQVDSYYVGIEEKKEIDYDYPVYSSDGLTIYSINDKFTLINRNFETFTGYPGLSINHGIVYNDGDEEPADDIDYIFIRLDNSVFINLQTMTIKTAINEYTIPVNSPIYFNTRYINYYTFDGEDFDYNRINDIYYDSIIKIGNVTLTYEEFLLNSNLVKEVNIEDEEIIEEEDEKEEEIEIKQEDDNEEVSSYIKPKVTVGEFKSNVYSIESSISISDPSGVITTYPTFEIYKPDGKLLLRKKISNNGDFKIPGLSADTEYKIIGTYKYKNENGITMVVTFFEGTITTKSADDLETIELTSELGDRYSNKIEIKDLTIVNKDSETVDGIKKVVLQVWPQNNTDSKNTYNLSYSQISDLIKGKATTISSSKDLKSNTTYNYEIKFYDKDSNELKVTGNNKGIIQTTKEVPVVNFKSKIDKENNDVSITIITDNKDSVNIKDYKYKLYSYSENIVEEGILYYDDQYENELVFNCSNDQGKCLDFNTNYILEVTGVYDLEDGKGEQELLEKKEFTTINLTTVINAWYDEETKEVTYNSIKAEIYIAPTLIVLDRTDTEIVIYLADKDGNDILDDSGNLRYYQSYSQIEYSANKTDTGFYYIDQLFEGLDSETEYMIKIKIKVKQLENDIVLSKDLTPTITTNSQDSYIDINYKRLIGDVFELSFDVVDPDLLINKSSVNIEIYEGSYENVEDIDSKYIYRTVADISEKTTDGRSNVMFALEGYNSDSYTVVVSAKPYNEVDVEKTLEIKSNLEEVSKETIILDREITTRVEMYQQFQNSTSNTEINIDYELGDFLSNLYALDCYDNTCNVLGYIDVEDTSFKSSESKKVEFELLSNSENKTEARIIFPNRNEDKEHTFYLVVEKYGITLGDNKSININTLKSLYILTSLDYNTNYQIYNIDSVDDMFDNNLIQTNNETRHYVVTENLDFYDSSLEDPYRLKSYRFNDFNGTIDFQGYNVDLYRNSNSAINLFYKIKQTAILKNAVVNYHLDYQGTVSDLAGIVQYNYGLIENFIVHVSQKYETGSADSIGLIARLNYGTIRKFAVYLDTDMYTYGYSSLVSNTNYSSGIIEYGYVSTLNDSIIYLQDYESGHGTFANSNSGTIRNVYNLVSVLATHSSYYTNTYWGIGTIVEFNNVSAIVQNTLSVATTTHDNSSKGPSVRSNSGKSYNNYYVDTNTVNDVFNNTFNKKISKSSLRSAGVLDVILNSEEETIYSITSGYYPIVNMSNFMSVKQPLVQVTFNIKESTISVVSGEVINDNKNDSGVAKVKVFISNPNELTIKDIEIKDSSSTELEVSIEEDVYDPNTQITTLTLSLKLPELAIAEESYSVTSLTYETINGTDNTIEYTLGDRRIDITLYRVVSNYTMLVKSLNKNENIFLSNDIEITSKCVVNSLDGNYIDSNDECLPDGSLNYSADFNGNEKYINFNGANISRGFFIKKLTGDLRNLGVKNLVLNSNSYNIGFISLIDLAKIDNVDLSNIKINADRRGLNKTNTVYLGTLTSYSTSSDISNVSVNETSITKDSSEGGKVYYFDAGGVVGYMSSTNLSNSYVYNLNVENIEYDTLIGYQTIGGISGYIDSTSSVKNCYSVGSIDTELSNIGGIVGTAKNSYVNNNYSSMTLASSGDYVAGIVGIYRKDSQLTNSVQYNLFVGILKNRNSKSNFDKITTNSTANYEATNYTLVSEDGYATITTNLTQFNSSDSFAQQTENSEDKETLPYLKQTSFAQQHVKDKKVGQSASENATISIEYIQDSDYQTCIDALSENYRENESYQNACFYKAVLTSDKQLTLTEENTNRAGTLKIESVEEIGDNSWKYTISPINYLSIYSLEIGDDSQSLDLSFYKKINDINDWNSLEKVYNENVLLLNDIKLYPDGVYENYINTESTRKKINNLLGNEKTIGMYTLKESEEELVKEELPSNKESLKHSVIEWVDGVVQDLTISGIKIDETNGNYAGVIRFNNGIITNCNFTDIKIVSYYNISGIIGLSTGYVNSVKMDNIDVTGNKWVGGLVGYDTSNDKGVVHIKDIEATNITVRGWHTVGGIAGGVDYSLENITASNVTIKGYVYEDKYYQPYYYIGGIVGYGDCSNSILKSPEDSNKSNNIYIYQTTDVGGIGGMNNSSTKTNLEVQNLLITSALPEEASGKSLYYQTENSTNVGGIYGYSVYNSNMKVENLVIGNQLSTNESGIKEYTAIVASSVGGVTGICYDIDKSIVKNSIIYATNSVGGMTGANTTAWPNTFEGNAVIKVDLLATEKAAGGIMGKYSAVATGDPALAKNIILDSRIQAKTASGGIIGHLQNSTSLSQNLIFSHNFVENCEVVASIEDGGIAGGLIGEMYKVPESETRRFDYSLFYGTVTGSIVGYGIGDITNINSSPGYGDFDGESSVTVESVSIDSNFKEFVLDVEYAGYQINSIEELRKFVDRSVDYNISGPSYNSYFTIPYRDGSYYFPVFSYSGYPVIDESDQVVIPTSTEISQQTVSTMFMRRTMLRSYSSTTVNPIDIDYDVYASDVNKLNIEFSGIDSDLYFYYQIGDYRSNIIPITNRVYTITYNFKDSVKIYLSNGSNYKTDTFTSSDLAKKITLVNDKTYYINSSILYGEDKSITGNFVNLYENSALMSDGRIYNISTGEVIDGNINYQVQETTKPLYTFTYEGKNINTYYNFSTIDNNIQEYQLIVKNGVLNLISSSLDNKKDSYIIDYYNNKEIQIILKDDTLYSMKYEISYPSDLVNDDIVELYSNINSSSNIVVLRYSNGGVYTFNYRTGDKLFTNISNDLSLMEYINSKLSDDSNKAISNISDIQELEEVEALKSKIEKISVSDASGKISNNNSSESNNKKYATVYNDVTKKYDIYSIEDIMNSNDVVESENNKIYKDYELVEFYKNVNSSQKEKSLSGIIMFTISIFAILGSLYLLIRHKKLRGV